MPGGQHYGTPGTWSGDLVELDHYNDLAIAATDAKRQRAARPRISVSSISIATVLWPPTGMMMSA
jgi:hypothetical protein